MRDTHDLGSFDTLEKVWDAYPYGGCPGDYVTIGGDIVRWNDGRRVWGNSGDDVSSTETQHVEGNLIVDDNLTVGGKTKGDTAEFKKIKVETLEVKNPPYALKEHKHDEDYAAKAHKHELKDVIGAGDGVVIPGKIEYAKHADNATHADKAHDIDEDSPVNDRFVSAINDDRAAGHLTLEQGATSEGLIQANGDINIGEFIDSLIAGKGIGLFPDGRMQADSLELRSSLTILELIFNRQSAQEGDTSFSESGLIESVERLEESTYRLPLRKRHDTDFTAFDWNDVIYGSVNDLATGGGNYRTSWMRVIGVNTTDNYIEVVLYPDAEVPGGKNYPPEPLMAITRRGNTSDEDRQSYWYISSYEKCICMLDGVTKPILEENNYSIIIGKMKRLALFDNLPINYRQSYVYCRGLIRQDDIRVNVSGKPIYELVDRGIWSPKERYYFEDRNEDTGINETSTVYHRGVKWQCLKTGTLLEPKWNSTGWAFLEGNGEFSIDFESSKGFSFFYGLIDTIIEAKFYHGSVDVTEDVMSLPSTVITWGRDTGMPAEDKSWYPSFVDGQKNKMHLISADMGSQWLNDRSVTFKISAVIPLGEEKYLRESEDLQFNL